MSTKPCTPPSECTARVVNKNTLNLVSLGRELSTTNVDNFDDFAAVLGDGDYLVLERRAPMLFVISRHVPAGSVLADIFAIAEKQRLDFGFPEELETELEQILAKDIDFSDCCDLSHLPFVTVDGPNTLDLDQALYVTKADAADFETDPNCVYVAYYAIADAAYFVSPDTPLYEEALNRGTSLYFASMSVPMLPRALSQGIISLNALVPRRSLVFVMQVAQTGHCLNTDLVRARIVSRAKLATPDVDDFLKNPDSHRFSTTEYADSLRAFQAVGELRLEESRQRNVVHFNRISLDVALNADKSDLTLGMDERSMVDLYNEQLSLLCNMEGAKVLNILAQSDPRVLAIFRNHEAPSERSLSDLSDTINAIAKAQNLGPEWRWNQEKQSLANFLDALPEASKTDDRLYRIRQAYERQILMMQRRSTFSPEAGLHSALGVNPYARFSAPMREIVGIFTHQEAIDAIDTTDMVQMDLEANAQLRMRVINAANRARSIQREMDKNINSYAISRVISHDYTHPLAKRPIRHGTILGMKPNALYVRLDMPPIELKVYVKDMNDENGDIWQIDIEKNSLSNADNSKIWHTGDPIGLRVSSYQEEKNKWKVVPA